jgi:hypothetical protein
MLEAVDVAALRVDAREEMADRAILSGGVHALENEEHRIAVGRIEEVLQRSQLLDVFCEKVLALLVRLVERSYVGWPLLEADVLSFRNAEIFGIDVHGAF